MNTRILQYLTLTMLFLTIVSCDYRSNTEELYKNVPTLEELSGIWVSVDTVDMEPSVRNFRGQALVNRDLTSISWFASAPYSGGYHTGTMKLNGKVPKVSKFRWQPYQALRQGSLDNWTIQSSTRMLFQKDAIMWKVEITNSEEVSRDLNIESDLIGFISKYQGDWQWWYPYPKLNGRTTIRDEETENIREYIGTEINSKEGFDYKLIDGKPTPVKTIMEWPTDEEILNSSKYTAKYENNILFIHDTETEAVTAFSIIEQPDSVSVKNSGATVTWQLNLKPNETTTIRYLMSFGDDKSEIESNITNWSDNFDSYYTSIQDSWNEKWEQIFQPGNSLISGCFPILETRDSLAHKVYYTGPLTMLYLMHTNLPMHDKVFLTGGPRWGASITFFWDITEWSTLWATVDPEMFKEHVSSWISIDPSKYYGQDNFGGKGVGNGYSANYWALFQMIRAYITVSGDFAFLDEVIDGKTILGHLEHYATNWQRISIYGQEGAADELYKLADFGDDKWNLLECVPTYKHIVPSFNAGYIWMMRETAAFYKRAGDTVKAETLINEADRMTERLLKLYAGDGVWYSLYPNGKKIEVRHCLDFMFLGRYMPDDIPKGIKAEMMDFVYRELITDNWMRAQSLKDVAAEQSDRADHGPLGAFDGWPAGTMDALTRLGFPEKALDFYHNIEPVTYEGIWAQAHELWGENKYKKNAKVRIAERGWHNRESSSGIAMSQVMLKNFFGFYPDVEGNPLVKNENWHFDGTLYHVKYAGNYYTLVSKDGKVEMIKE